MAKSLGMYFTGSWRNTISFKIYLPEDKIVFGYSIKNPTEFEIQRNEFNQQRII